MPKFGKKIIAIIPARNAAKTIERVIDDIPRDWVDEIFLSDNASNDQTVARAETRGIIVFRHTVDRGYGGNQKTCYREALKASADIVIMIHADHQYDPKLAPLLIEPLLKNEADAIFGSRMMIKSDARKGGMSWWRFAANIALTSIENIVLRMGLTEYHSGYRAYTKEVLLAVPFEKNSDNYVFDTEIIAQMSTAGFSIKEVPIPTYYFPEASSPNFFQSVHYGLSILLVTLKYLLHHAGIKRYAFLTIQKRATF